MNVKNLVITNQKLGSKWYTKEFKDNWLKTMAESMSYNQRYDTFTITDVKEAENDFKCIIKIPYGLSLDQLIDLIPYVEERMNCTFDLWEIDKFNAGARFIIPRKLRNNNETSDELKMMGVVEIIETPKSK